MKYILTLLITIFVGFSAFADTSLSTLPSTCVNAYDECHNACMRTESGEWACTMMACETKKAPVCTQFKYETVDQLPATCTNALDECGNACMKMEDGNWACTKMACETKVAPVCTHNNNDEVRFCTMEYMPMCGVDGITYGNACMAGDVKIAYPGECLQSVGGDSDEHGCKASAGYVWNTTFNACMRPWEQQQIFDFAMSQKLTITTTIEAFRPNDSVTRQEAASIFSHMALSMKPNVYVSTAEKCGAVYADDSMIASDFKAIVYQACAMEIMVGNKGYFYPNQSITRGEAFSVIMKILDEPAKSPTTPMWLSYTNRSNELGLMTFTDMTKFDQPITRWELIEWIYTFSQKIK